jgi:hypothetical protein
MVMVEVSATSVTLGGVACTVVRLFCACETLWDSTASSDSKTNARATKRYFRESMHHSFILGELYERLAVYVQTQADINRCFQIPLELKFVSRTRCSRRFSEDKL